MSASPVRDGPAQCDGFQESYREGAPNLFASRSFCVCRLPACSLGAVYRPSHCFYVFSTLHVYIIMGTSTFIYFNRIKTALPRAPPPKFDAGYGQHYQSQDRHKVLSPWQDFEARDIGLLELLKLPSMNTTTRIRKAMKSPPSSITLFLHTCDMLPPSGWESLFERVPQSRTLPCEYQPSPATAV